MPPIRLKRINTRLYDKLVELRTAQETELNNLMAKINKLAVPL